MAVLGSVLRASRAKNVITLQIQLDADGRPSSTGKSNLLFSTGRVWTEVEGAAISPFCVIDKSEQKVPQRKR